jgi:hypothetical protein
MGNGTLVPKWARRWSGASTHHRWDARTRCREAPGRRRRYASGVIPSIRRPRGWPRGLTAASAVLATALVVAACSSGGAASFDPTGPCTADGAAPGAYPDLETRIPTSYEGQGPGRLDSGRHCSAANLGSLAAAGITEVRYAGGTWDFGGDAAAALVVFQADGLTADLLADFYAQSARAADRTTITAQSTPTLAGRPGHRIDTMTGSRTQTIVVWPSAEPDIVDVVITNELPDPKVQAAVDAFGGR